MAKIQVDSSVAADGKKTLVLSGEVGGFLADLTGMDDLRSAHVTTEGLRFSKTGIPVVGSADVLVAAEPDAHG